MARGFKTGGKNFEKGKVSNPHGRGASYPVIRKIRAISQEQIAEIATILLEGNLDNLKQVLIDPEASVLQQWIASVAIKGTERGDPNALNALLDRVAGKVKNHTEIDVTNYVKEREEVAQLSNEELIAAAEEAIKKAKDET